MIDHKTIDDLARRLGEALPEGVRNMQQDIEKNMRAVLSSAFDKLDLVTREELDVQKAVLERTRSRIEEMETRLSELERQIHHHSD